MSDTNIQVLLARRPQGWVQEEDFSIVETAIPSSGAGEVLVKNQYLSLDPYMRGRMSEAKSYAASVALGQVMVGGTVGQVVESNNPAFPTGATVVGNLGWQLYAVSNGQGLRIVDPTIVPPSAYLGVVGMPGVTAYVGLFDIGQPKPGETVVVSAAAGAVGSVVGQLAKRHGARAVGIAGGAEKCAYVVERLGFDACVDYKAENFREALAAAVPNGIDVYFENVGGDVLDAVLEHLNVFARIPFCGMISQYNEADPRGFRGMRRLLSQRVKLQGFIVGDHLDRWPTALAELAKAVASGEIAYDETVAEGIRNAPSAFIGMLKGKNLGKQLVKLS
ncbi:NADP-dependent oxidoreductase [Chloroflexia bacterium SDU3-3]|nr:NADP-dependent oxidoreductase [Chloroflexia bacterium SDU3-3]